MKPSLQQSLNKQSSSRWSLKIKTVAKKDVFDPEEASLMVFSKSNNEIVVYVESGQEMVIVSLIPDQSNWSRFILNEKVFKSWTTTFNTPGLFSHVQSWRLPRYHL